MQQMVPVGHLLPQRVRPSSSERRSSGQVESHVRLARQQMVPVGHAEPQGDRPSSSKRDSERCKICCTSRT